MCVSEDYKYVSRANCSCMVKLKCDVQHVYYINFCALKTNLQFATIKVLIKTALPCTQAVQVCVTRHAEFKLGYLQLGRGYIG